MNSLPSPAFHCWQAPWIQSAPDLPWISGQLLLEWEHEGWPWARNRRATETQKLLPAAPGSQIQGGDRPRRRTDGVEGGAALWERSGTESWREELNGPPFAGDEAAVAGAGRNGEERSSCTRGAILQIIGGFM
jgi:hypothetical protein